MRRKLFIIAFCLILIPFGIYCQNNHIPSKQVIALIDFEMLHCSLCMEQFLIFIDFLKVNELIKNTGGILISENNQNAQISILQKQLSGFMIGNNIGFPISIDELGIFQKIKLNYDVILINWENKNVNFYKFSDFILMKQK